MAFWARLRRFAFYLSGFVFVGSSVVVSVFYYFGRDLPSELTLLDYFPPQTTRIYSSDGDLIEEYAVEHRQIVKFNDIPLIVKGAFIIAEDREFYSHSGLSLQSLVRAIVENTARKSWDKKPAGGSTITQQIAKNLLVGNARTISRKIREAIMAFRIEASIPKDRILEIYLNQLYLGKGRYGIAEACRYYFGKQLRELEPHEAAFLAALPSAPMIYMNPKNYERLLMKRNAIICQMYDMGYISKAQRDICLKKPIEVRHDRQKLYAPYFSDEVFKLFCQRVSKNAFFQNGYSIKTALNKDIQSIAQKALEDGLIEYTKTTRWHGTLGNVKSNLNLKEIEQRLPSTINKIGACWVKAKHKDDLLCETADKRTIRLSLSKKFYGNAKIEVGDIVLYRFIAAMRTYELYQTPEVTGGIIVMDAQSGDVLAMSGGYSFDISPFNCMTQAMRQPGSAIKPFVYAAAIESGKDEYDIVEDKPITITLKSGEKYTPHNYNGKSYGKTPLRNGLIYSRNLSTVNLACDVGMSNISNLLFAMGLVHSKVPISAVLGSVETTPLQVLSAFSAFFNEGEMVEPRFVKEVNQRSLEEFFCKPKRKKVLSKKTADTIQNILHDTVRYGTANAAAKLEDDYGVELFGKTGTTNDFKDAWFVGAIKRDEKTYLVCVFVGYPIPKSLGNHCFGAKVALPIFANFTRSLCADAYRRNPNPVRQYTRIAK
ncbi:MAG: transglycosylase domain-containing protein [Alphaproteobacteria bacterium]|nr:transglycosylase domain-containing protein [Alphaproteobacteria bacterium]